MTRSRCRLTALERHRIDCSRSRMPTMESSSTSKICSFCNLAEDNELEYGKIYEHDGIVTHYYCLLLSSNMEQKGTDDEGILGFLAEDIQKELRRGKRLVCSYCKKQGATLGCCNVRCKRIFHFPCGVKAGSLHQFFGEFRSYCVNHRPKQKIDDHVLKQVASVDVVCYICYDKVNTNDFVKTLWAPCCKKDAWFHRSCVQQLALSAGYFFKCPLCNNKKDFQKAMLEYGIFVPSQDASWELVPNAFEELLYRHDQCDASKCLCPKGRKYTSNNAKWELALCRTCGSQGIHMACGQLKWANPLWDCDECTSILYNKHVRLANNSAIDSSNQNKESDSDLDSGSDTDSVDSDTDISVGTDFPVSCTLVNSSSSSSMDSILNVRMRPGPRSFKLQQQLLKLGKWLELTNTDSKKNINIEASPKDTNESSSKIDEKKEPSSKIDEKKEPSTSKKDIPQQENKEDSRQKEKESLSKNDEKAQPIPKKTDVITIESDDDDDDVEIITLKRKTNFPPIPTMQQFTQFGNSQIPSVSTWKKITPLNAIEYSVAFKSQNATATELSKNNHVNVPASGSEVSNESTISDQVNVAASQEFTIESRLTSNDLDETDSEDTSETSVMNIKIVNVTSLSPEVFESVPQVCDNISLRTNITDTSSLSANKTFEQLATHIPSTKRSIYEANSVTDNCKKIKRNSFDEKSPETSSPIGVIIASDINKTNNTQDDPENNTNNKQNKSTSASNSSEIEKKAKNPTKSICTSTENSLLNNNQLNNKSTQYIQLHNTNDTRQLASQILSQLEGNLTSVNNINIHQNNENSVGQRNKTEFMTFAKNNGGVLVPIGGYYLQQIPNPNFTNLIGQNATRTNETNMYVNTIPSSSVILPQVTSDNITVLSNPTLLGLNQPVVASVTGPILSDKQIVAVNRQEAASKGNVPRSMPSLGNNSTSKSYCDGAAGTTPVETAPTTCRKDDSGDFHRNVFEQIITCQKSVATRSVFPQVTNNHNTCHQPRLIPRYMNLQDLKFQVCTSNNVQMTLYDTFSVNISMKNPKEGQSRLACVAAPRELKESSIFEFREASCSSDYVDNISTDRQRSDKLSCSSKNEKCSINEKSTCTKYLSHSRDDSKENLDPIKSRILSHNGIPDNVNPTSNIDDAVTVSNRICGENNNETCPVSTDTNLNVLGRTIYNTNVDSVTDSVTFISNNCDQGLRINLEDSQQHKQTSVPAKKKPGARLFFNEPSRIIHNVDFDLNVVNMNKNVEKISQNDIVALTSQHTDCNGIGNDHTDDSPTLKNGYNHLDGTNITRPKINNRNIARVSNIVKVNEYNIVNKQFDASDSKKFIQCIAFQENTIRRNGEIRAKSNEFCLKVSIDLRRIQKLIDSKPKLFENGKRDVNDQWHARTSRLPGLDNHARQQVRYREIENNINCPSKNRESQKSNYACNIERMQRDVFPGADTFLKYQKSSQEVEYFNKDNLDR